MNNPLISLLSLSPSLFLSLGELPFLCLIVEHRKCIISEQYDCTCTCMIRMYTIAAYPIQNLTSVVP